jgi:hypothetical protein
MKIVLLRGGCGNGRTCPTLNSTDRDSYIVQGYVAPQGRHLRAGQAVVTVPLSLLPELACTASANGHVLPAAGGLMVTGTQVTDAEALRTLALPDGENAVEIPKSLVPELELCNAG